MSLLTQLHIFDSTLRDGAQGESVEIDEGSRGGPQGRSHPHEGSGQPAGREQAQPDLLPCLGDVQQGVAGKGEQKREKGSVHVFFTPTALACYCDRVQNSRVCRSAPWRKRNFPPGP